MADDLDAFFNGDSEPTEEELEALFAAEVEKAKQADDEPSEDELEAMFAAEVAKEQAASASAPPPPKPRPSVNVSPVNLPAYDNLPGQSSMAPPMDINLDMILDIPVEVHVEVGHTRVKVSEILRLDIGSVVELNRVAGHPADIIVNGKLIGQGDVVVVNENFGIRVTKLVGLEERLSSV
ncbi:MAG: flagellar motor switch protein FliN [Spartobacteria bacterium]|nr:flagellar motor switch protein FliN [Spartobacteria bacterium]